MDWIDKVVQDVAELDYNSPEDQPNVMLVKAGELRAILEAAGDTCRDAFVQRALAAKNEAETRELEAAQEADELRALADSEGTRAVEYLRRARAAEADANKSERRAIAFGDIVERQVIAMQAAALEGHLKTPAHGLQWIANTPHVLEPKVKTMSATPEWTPASEAMRWLNEVELVQGGSNGPTIKLRAAISALLDQLASFTPLRAKGVVDADDNLDCWDTNPYEICTLHVAALNEKDPAAMWRVVDLFARDEGPNV